MPFCLNSGQLFSYDGFCFSITNQQSLVFQAEKANLEYRCPRESHRKCRFFTLWRLSPSPLSSFVSLESHRQSYQSIFKRSSIFNLFGFEKASHVFYILYILFWHLCSLFTFLSVHNVLRFLWHMSSNQSRLLRYSPFKKLAAHLFRSLIKKSK